MGHVAGFREVSITKRFERTLQNQRNRRSHLSGVHAASLVMDCAEELVKTHRDFSHMKELLVVNLLGI